MRLAGLESQHEKEFREVQEQLKEARNDFKVKALEDSERDLKKRLLELQSQLKTAHLVIQQYKMENK